MAMRMKADTLVILWRAMKSIMALYSVGDIRNVTLMLWSGQSSTLVSDVTGSSP